MSASISAQRSVIELFNVYVVDSTFRDGAVNLDLVDRGIVTNFNYTKHSRKVFEETFQPLNVNTLFTRQEVERSSIQELLTKQLLHYVEVYGLHEPGLFDLVRNNGQVIPMRFIYGITKEQLAYKVKELIYRNAPIKEIEPVQAIIKHYDIDYNINHVANNEARVALYDVDRDQFKDGDDAVRWIAYKASLDTSALLIKSKEVIENVRCHSSKISAKFLEKHQIVLAQVFNRHKRILLAMKKCKGDWGFNPKTRKFDLKLATTEYAPIINKISRLSKTHHIPLKESVNKRFIRLAEQTYVENKNRAYMRSTGTLTAAPEQVVTFEETIDHWLANHGDSISLTDKFKYLNLLQYRASNPPCDIYAIRNGKVHVTDVPTKWNAEATQPIIDAVLRSLKIDLAHLNKSTILLDPRIEYGLPISAKQSVGRLPYGSIIEVEGSISSGIHWRNEWGATDLDLSCVNAEGVRTGWGGRNAYDASKPIKFSGDVTTAKNGAMEFMTSSDVAYSLMVNIYRGDRGSEMDLVIGSTDHLQISNQWMEQPIIQEHMTLPSKQMVLGFVENNKFTVWCGQIGNRSVSSAKFTDLISRGTCGLWTLNKLFDTLDINYHTKRVEHIDYDYDLTYSQTSFESLVNLFE